jgi:hypothetical protein
MYNKHHYLNSINEEQNVEYSLSSVRSTVYILSGRLQLRKSRSTTNGTRGDHVTVTAVWLEGVGQTTLD